MNYDIEYVSLEKASKFNYSHILTVIREDGVFDVVSDFYTTLLMEDYPSFFRDIQLGSGAYDFLISFQCGPCIEGEVFLAHDQVKIEANFQTLIISKAFFNQINMQIAEMAIGGIEKFNLLEKGIIDADWKSSITAWLAGMKEQVFHSQRMVSNASFT